ncbi:MAG: HAMP domain-containing protein, partial [Bacteroidia bacterium]
MALGNNLKFKKDKLIQPAGQEENTEMIDKAEETEKAGNNKAETTTIPTPATAATATPAPAKEEKDLKKKSVSISNRPVLRTPDMIDESVGAGKKLSDDSDYTYKQLRRVLFALDAFKKGDISVRLSKEDDDIFAEIAEAYNSMVEMIGGVGGEVSRISKVAGVEGNLKARASAENATGFWRDMINNINGLVDSIAVPVLEVGKVLKNISRGNLDETFQIPVSGDFKVMAETINKTIDNLNLFAGEVTRVALEVGTEGKLGGQASVPNVAGVWKELTDNVNYMASNLTSQVRDIANVATAVARGDLSQKITVDVRGELLQLKENLNQMVDSLNIFAGEVTRVAREVG